MLQKMHGMSMMMVTMLLGWVLLLLLSTHVQGFRIVPAVHLPARSVRFTQATLRPNLHCGQLKTSHNCVHGQARLQPLQFASSSVTASSPPVEDNPLFQPPPRTPLLPTNALTLSLLSAVIGLTTGFLVYYSKLFIFGINRTTLVQHPFLLPVLGGLGMSMLIRKNPNAKKPPILPLTEHSESSARHAEMWPQLLVRYVGAYLSIGAGAALGMYPLIARNSIHSQQTTLLI
jgi:hypothetical protein